MSAVEVRRLSGAEAETLQGIVSMLPQPEWRGACLPSLGHLQQALDAANLYVFAAFAGGRPAGFASAYRFPSLTSECDLAYVYDVYVAPGLRGRGIGRRLVDALLDALRGDGVAEAWVGTDGDNVAAQRLYSVTGAALVGRDFAEFEYDLAARQGSSAREEA